jgi:hypothetical protein
VITQLSILDVYEHCKGIAARTHRLPNGDYIVRCPTQGHEDKHPSCRLSVRSNFWMCYACLRGGKKRLESSGYEGSMLGMVVLAGHARTLRDAAEWLERRAGVQLRDLPQQPRTKRHYIGDRSRARLRDERIAGIYPYHDIDGNTLYEAVRYEGLDEQGRKDKRFAGRRPTDKGWSYDLRDVPRVPYRLPDIRRACEERRTLLVVEGEKKAERLRELGFTATTNYGGAAYAWPASWARHFAGLRAALILADSDEPGRKAAIARKAFFEERVGACAAIVDFFPERTNGDDIEQWLDEHAAGPDGARRTKAELALALQAELRRRCKRREAAPKKHLQGRPNG